MRLPTLLFLAISLNLSACSDSPALLDPVENCPAAFVDGFESGWNQGYLVGAEERSFYLQKPEGKGPHPLLVMFNGTNEIADGFYDRTRASEFVDAGFVVVAPQDVGHGTIWPVWDAMRESGDENRSGEDLDFFDSLVACTRSHVAIDKRRIFVAGHSAGGIMTNFVLQRRSSLLAGGIIASGILSLTAPDPGEALDSMAVLVTWGGDNDAVRGLEGLPEFNFYEQAVLASRYYQEEDAVKQLWCRGDELGHAWLDHGNAMMIDFLLAHPKGKNSNWSFSPPADSENFSCGESALAYTPLEQVSCPLSDTEGCQTYCDFIGDCVVENGTVQPVLAPQIKAIGFGGEEDITDCRGCLDLCEGDALLGGEVDASVLACLSESAAVAECGPGIEGAMPFIDGFNACCTGQDASKVCESLCLEILTNNVAKGFFAEGCAAWTSP